MKYLSFSSKLAGNREFLRFALALHGLFSGTWQGRHGELSGIFPWIDGRRRLRRRPRRPMFNENVSRAAQMTPKKAAENGKKRNKTESRGQDEKTKKNP